MLHEVKSLKLMAVGLALLVASWLVILFMVIRLIEPSLLLSLGAYAASVVGLTVGLFGVAQYVGGRSRHEEPGATGGHDRAGRRYRSGPSTGGR